MKTLAFLAFVLGIALASGCGASSGGKVPVDHPMYQYQPPEMDDDTDTDEPDEPDDDGGDEADE
jgi:hypothetical protein